MITDPALHGDWHLAARADAVRHGESLKIRLLQQDIDISRNAAGKLLAVPAQATQASAPAAENGQPASATERYGLVWVCLGEPAQDVLAFPEFDDPRYQKVVCGPYGVRASGPRIVENFLDMAHLPFVHAGILGDESYSEVLEYNAEAGVQGEGPVSANCLFWQPKPTAVAEGASDVRYTFRVLRPFSAVLTKVLSNVSEASGGHGLSILLSVQPVEPAFSIVWILYAVTDHAKSDAALRARQELVFMQDKPILENQLPALLPLAPQAELSVRSDRLSLAYRRYLREQGLRFGVTHAG
ncbi:MAG: aromatic ring-hydroxylating dioxygenase subunit alpha [Betaproteobacteria bacterium]|nr:aromatic ring-hydroxylating dioxygenase subunit alpha [Betaproteobacteria bacterium]